jgi:tryptophan-rich sensory protein
MELASKSQLRWAFIRAAAVFVLGLFSLAGLSTQLGSGGQGAWYASLAKPEGFPGLGTFVVVWTLGYVLMAFAAAIVWQAKGNRLRAPGLFAWSFTAVLALAWMPALFGFKSMGGGLGVSVVLVLAALLTTGLFFKMRPVAGVLMLLPLLWFAAGAYLSYSIRAMNPGGVPAGTPAEAPPPPPAVDVPMRIPPAGVPGDANGQ